MDSTFIINFSDDLQCGVRSMDFDAYESAERLAIIANRPCIIREVGYDDFSRTSVDRIRFEMRA